MYLLSSSRFSSRSISSALSINSCSVKYFSVLIRVDKRVQEHGGKYMFISLPFGKFDISVFDVPMGLSPKTVLYPAYLITAEVELQISLLLS